MKERPKNEKRGVWWWMSSMVLICCISVLPLLPTAFSLTVMATDECPWCRSKIGRFVEVSRSAAESMVDRWYQ